jgi:hypothetical protein
MDMHPSSTKEMPGKKTGSTFLTIVAIAFGSFSVPYCILFFVKDAEHRPLSI